MKRLRTIRINVLLVLLAAITWVALSRFNLAPQPQQALAQCVGTHNIVTIASGTSASANAFAIDLDIGSDNRPFASFFVGNSVRGVKCVNDTCSPVASNTPSTPGAGQPDWGTSIADYGIATLLQSNNNPLITHFSSSGGNQEKFIACNNSSCTSTSSVYDGATLRSYVNATRAPDGNVVILNGVAEVWNLGAISGRKCTAANCNPPNQIEFGNFLRAGGILTSAYRPVPLMPSSNRLIVAYSKWSSNSLVVYQCNSTNCSNGSEVTVDAGGVNNSYTPAVLRSNGTPAVAYNKNGTIKLVLCGNEACSSGNTIRTIDSNTSNTGRISLAIGTDGIPVMSYFRGGATADLYVARCNDSTCSGTTTINRINTGGVSNQDTVIALRSGNRPGILFRDNSGNLKYVVCIDAACTPDVSSCITPTPTPDVNQKPTGVNVIEDDANGGSIIQTYNVRVGWTPPLSSVFASGNTRYHVYISSNPTFTGAVVDVIRAKTVNWYSSTGDSVATNIIKNNQQYYVRVCAEYDMGGTWDAQCAPDITYTKVPYAQAVLTGAVNQRIVSPSAPASCSAGLPTRFMGTLSLSPNTSGYSSNCTTSPGSGNKTNFSCTVTLDNINYNPDPLQTFTLAMSGGASVYGCNGNCAAPGSCSNVFSPRLDANQAVTTSASAPLYVNADLAASFFKVKNMSVYTQNGISSPFPVGHLPFNASDTGDDYFNQGSSGGNNTGVGVVVSNGAQNAGLSTAANGGISARGWRSSTYSYNATQFVGTSFINYARGSKTVTTIASLTDSAFTSATSGIFLVSGNITLDSSAVASLNGKNVVLMTQGTARISQNLTLPSGTVALFADTIYVDDAVSTVTALLSAQRIYLTTSSSTTSTTPLSIIGGISSSNAVDMSRRARTDNDLMPSVFVQGNPSIYITLLEPLSNSKTEYRQIQ